MNNRYQGGEVADESTQILSRPHLQIQTIHFMAETTRIAMETMSTPAENGMELLETVQKYYTSKKIANPVTQKITYEIYTP